MAECERGMHAELLRRTGASIRKCVRRAASTVVVEKLRALREEFDEASNDTNGFDAIALPKRLDVVQRLIDSLNG